jgi:prolyl oligopeptidase
MSSLIAPPVSLTDPVTETIHGVSVADPYRWLEEADSPKTRQWLDEQERYARAYLNHLPGRERIRERIREFLAVETFDSFLLARNRYVFRKRLAYQEQPSIYTREGAHGADQLLIDPAERGTGKYTAVRPVQLSPDGKLLLYEVKQGGERTGVFELFDIESRTTLADLLPRGFLRGFAFTPDNQGFFYAHEPLDGTRPFYRAAHLHVLGTPSDRDREIFSAGEDRNLRLCLLSDQVRVGFLVFRFLDKTRTDFYLQSLGSDGLPVPVFAEAPYTFSPRLVQGRIFASTDRDAPNLRIVELCESSCGTFDWREIVPEQDSRIHQWMIAGDRIVVSYIWQTETRISVFSLDGGKLNEWPARPGGQTLRFLTASRETDEVLIETETFTHPIATLSWFVRSNRFDLWAERAIPFPSDRYAHAEIRYRSKDGTEVPMFLVGRRDVLRGGCHPAILTSYGGYGVPMTAQFSIFVAFLLERGCLFALPQIRGGSEFGTAWHTCAKRQSRQKAYDDFLAAAEWLVRRCRTTPDRLAIFGGSNSGLLVGAALTQRPDLFRAVVCLAPLLDMLRYHLFDHANVWRDEFGTADDADDFRALLAYSPYHRVHEGVRYPAALIVSGDVDQSCNPLHARKMTARLQAASSSGFPILLDHTPFRGHSPVLPLSDRIDALTDRMAFLCEQLGVAV